MELILPNTQFDGLELWNSDYYQAIGSAKMGLNLSHSYLGSDNVNKKTTAKELYLYSSDRISNYTHGLRRNKPPQRPPTNTKPLTPKYSSALILES